MIENLFTLIFNCSRVVFNFSFLILSTIAFSNSLDLELNADSSKATISVLNFGAKGDGITDDTQAFHAAFAIAKGRSVSLEGRRFKVNLKVVNGNFSIIGDGAVLMPYLPNQPVISIIPEKYIYDLKLSDFQIVGYNYLADGIYVNNRSIENGADFLTMHGLLVTRCRFGLHIEGRSIWNKIYNSRFDWNIGGLRIETELPCNLWEINATTFNHNKNFGVWIKNLNALNVGFKNFKFNSCNMEGNGTEFDEGYGCMFSGMEMLILENVYVEGNKGKKKGIGIKITGPLGRAFVINGCWIGESEYPLVIDGEKKWGTISNSMIDCSPYKSSYDIYLNTNWFNNEPKIKISNVLGRVSDKLDNSGSTPLNGIDWVTNYSNGDIDLQYRDWVKIFNDGNSNVINSITGIYSGRRIGIINYTTKSLPLIIKGKLMFNGIDFVIKPNDLTEFLVDGYPTEGKLRPL